MEEFLQAALDEARKGRSEGGFPIGSVLVHDGRIIGRGRNRRIQKGSPILHAEMDALEDAGRQPPEVYRASTLYTTLSPCAMCSGAIVLYGIPRVVIGENRSFLGEEATRTPQSAPARCRAGRSRWQGRDRSSTTLIVEPPACDGVLR